ncbi:nitroimidazol reductase NimA-like FMN-containing flavoprotein (pyridoxamine 5'-phosphate oxidase superfamily) [Pseudarthrobacter sp. SLBN-100]
MRQVSVGRLAFWIDDRPDIFPLNYIVDHGTVVFRTAEGSKFASAIGEIPVALQAEA